MHVVAVYGDSQKEEKGNGKNLQSEVTIHEKKFINNEQTSYAVNINISKQQYI